ncbi:HEPN domain-containing protein [Rhodococcus sp. MS13]|uniref:ApeA N-terminal domain 1-containing protein n=1 Tax=Rhodococcus sp. MS13 TaxID=2579940 RepID=UPI001561CF9E|nr:HEPN domain-containing protein [Rhodococcus sp. MS13]
MNSQTFSGYWWCSDDASNTQPGTLSIASDGSVVLELIEGFDVQQYTPLPDGSIGVGEGRTRIDVIHGATTAGKDFTLLDCLVRRYNMGFGTPTEQRLSARYALVGLHLEDADAEVFDTCRLRIENLRTWMAIGEYKIAHNEDGRERSATVTTPEPVTAKWGEFTIQADMYATPFNYYATRDEAVFSSRTAANLTITSETPRSYRGFHEVTMAIVDLLTLASDRPCAVISQRLVGQPIPVTYPNMIDGGKIGTLTREETPEAAVYARRTVTASPDAKELHLHDFLFTCQDMPFEELVVRWLDVRRRVVRATNMLFSLKYSKPGFLQTQVLTAAVSAEALSRCLTDPNAVPMPTRDFDSMVRELRIAIGRMRDEDRKRFEGLLRNEIGYRDRLNDVASMPPQAVVAKIIPDVEVWAKELMNVRNGIAHGLDQSYSEPRNLFLLLQRTQYLIYLVLMTELGLPEPVLDRAVEANQYLMYLYKDEN